MHVQLIKGFIRFVNDVEYKQSDGSWRNQGARWLINEDDITEIMDYICTMPAANTGRIYFCSQASQDFKYIFRCEFVKNCRHTYVSN